MIQWTRSTADECVTLADKGERESASNESDGELQQGNAFTEFSYKVGIAVVIALLCMILITSLRASVI